MTRVFILEEDEISSIEHVSSGKSENISTTGQYLIDKKEKDGNITRKKDSIDKVVNMLSARKEHRNVVDNTYQGCKFFNNICKDESRLKTSLDQEKAKHEEKNKRRKNLFESLILGGEVEVSWTKGFLTVIGIIIASLISTLYLTVVPAHDVVQNPQYWYEILYHGTIGHISISIGFCVPASWFMNISQMRKPRTLAIVCLISNVVGNTWVLLNYIVWTHILHFEYPVPFLGYTHYGIDVIISIIALYFNYPKSWRNDSTFKTRMKFSLVLVQYLIILDIANTIVTEILREFPNQYQPIIALLLPLNREIILFIFPRFIDKTACGDASAAEIVLHYAVSAQHTIWMCLNLGSFTTNVTSWVLMGIDFSLNIFLCSRIIWRKIRKHNKIDEQISTVQQLATYELAEFHAPLAFTLIFVVAYYGPNAGLFGNISNDYWGFTPVENIGETIENMLIFFLADFASSVLSAIMLWYFCKINLWKVFLLLQNEFGITFTIVLSEFVMVVSIH